MTLEHELKQMRCEMQALRAEVAELKQQVQSSHAGESANGDGPNVALFREYVQKYIRHAPHLDHKKRTQRELADAVGVHPVELSNKLHGKSALTPGLVREIVKTLVVWGAIDTRNAARDLLRLMQLEDLTSSQWRAIQQQRRDEFPLPDHPPSAREHLRSQLAELDLVNFDQRVGAFRQPGEQLYAFCTDRMEAPHLRVVAFEVYLHINGTHNGAVGIARALLRDFDPTLRKFALQKIKHHHVNIADDDLLRAVNDHQQDIAVHAVKLAAELLKRDAIPTHLLGTRGHRGKMRNDER